MTMHVTECHGEEHGIDPRDHINEIESDHIIKLREDLAENYPSFNISELAAKEEKAESLRRKLDIVTEKARSLKQDLDEEISCLESLLGTRRTK